MAEADVETLAAVARRMRDEDMRDGLALSWAADRDDLAGQVLARFGALPGWTWVAGDERPIAAIGVGEVWPGVGQAWLIATDEWPRIASGMARWVRRTMFPTLLSSRLHRVDTVAAATRPVAHRWLEWCGFRPSGALPAYGRAGEDFLRFTMLR